MEFLCASGLSSSYKTGSSSIGSSVDLLAVQNQTSLLKDQCVSFGRIYRQKWNIIYIVHIHVRLSFIHSLSMPLL